MDGVDVPAQASGVLTLAELIQRYRDGTGSSYEDLAKRSDWVISRQVFYRLATQPPRSFPKSAETVKAIASALDSDVTTITLAYARSLGLDVRPAGHDFTRDLPDGQLVRELGRRLLDRAEALAEATAEDQGPRATIPAGIVLKQNEHVASWQDTSTTELEEERARVDYELARRSGQPDRVKIDTEQDDAAERPDAEGPEHGA